MFCTDNKTIYTSLGLINLCAIGQTIKALHCSVLINIDDSCTFMQEIKK